jgi:hypothetical protein
MKNAISITYLIGEKVYKSKPTTVVNFVSPPHQSGLNQNISRSIINKALNQQEC